jgi:hypothetical protein
MVELRSSIADRHHYLEKVGLVVRDVSAAIGIGQYKTAVEWMGQGNSVIWSQLFQFRTAVDDLKQLHPDLMDVPC